VTHKSILSKLAIEEIRLAIAEDIGSGDITAALLDDDIQAVASVISREPMVLAGQAWFEAVFQEIDPAINILWHRSDGDSISANTALCELHGRAKSLLTGERTALNFLQTLSATATVTRQYVELIQHTTCKILDTRKTIPGLRDAQKYAVTCGGGQNHRHGLYDGILIKENHIIAADSIKNAVEKIRTMNSVLPIEVEVENLDELEQALKVQVDIILLDNMDIATLKQAVQINAGRAKLEASGNINVNTIAEIAETGIDFISIGALTKHIHAIDLSMRIKQK